MMLGGEPRPDDRDCEPAEPGHGFEPGGLGRQIAEQFETDLLIAAHQLHKAAAPAGNRLKRDQVVETLDRLGHIRAQKPERVPRRAAEAVNPRPGHHRRQRREQYERQQSESDRPGGNGQNDQHGRGHQHRH